MMFAFEWMLVWGVQKDLADLACEHEKQRAIKRKQTEYRKYVHTLDAS